MQPTKPLWQSEVELLLKLLTLSALISIGIKALGGRLDLAPDPIAALAIVFLPCLGIGAFLLFKRHPSSILKD